MGIELCEPSYLYNLLNQYRRVSRLAEPNYLCLLDARSQREYNESHIVTARRILQSPTGEYLVPDSEELRCVRHCVVYDCETNSLDCCDYEEEEGEKAAEEGAALRHAQGLDQFTHHPVLVLRGGYQRFSASYHFLRTQKVLWMPQELDNFQPYPVEILPGKLYLGNFKQACDQQILKDLKIKAQVNISEQPAALCSAGGWSSAAVLQPGHQPEQRRGHGLSDALLPVLPEASLEPCSEMQKQCETSPGLCGAALSLGDPNLRDQGHRCL
ncbi:serine/threonine/tyrosine-interacting-like protein 1 isoform X2 [Pogoniulus pusillus]|uniref:serine/threonine/tyrosine-interacting-like protein 1 isoform X2 n=1 Tax=Pogoniulus pusillus TaxID=488313 RepID=UPI0030B97C96